MSLDSASYPLLWAFSDQTGVLPEYILPVLFHESGFDPSLPNIAGAPYYGLNQVSGDYLAQRGIAVADYLTWPASRQLQQVVLPFLHAYAQARSATRLYQANFLPATLPGNEAIAARYGLQTATNLSDVVAASPSAYYRDNQDLDVDRNGAITVGDLAAVMQKAADNPHVQQAIANAYALRPGESPKDPVYGDDFTHPSTKAAIIAFGILTAAAVGIYGIEVGWFDGLLGLRTGSRSTHRLNRRRKRRKYRMLEAG